MKRKKIAVVGSGAYGCYLVSRMVELGFDDSKEIYWYEAGDHNIKNQNEIGLEIFSSRYRGASHGRFFGFGGTTNRWGGQILFFDKFDFIKGSNNWNKIVKSNIKYSSIVNKHLKLPNLNPNKRLVTGAWLHPFRRNFFKKKLLQKIKLFKNHLLLEVTKKNGKYNLIFDKNKTVKEFDEVYLTVGAIETARILLNSKNNILSLKKLRNKFPISDHLSFKSHNIFNSDFNFQSLNLNPEIGFHGLLTKRVRIKSKNYYGFIHPIFNEEVHLFNFIKKYIFKIDVKKKIDFFHVFIDALLFFTYLLAGKLYVSKNKNSIQVDLEKTSNLGNITFHEKSSKISWEVTDVEVRAFRKIQLSISKFLKQNKIKYEELNLNNSDKIVDTYHPTSIFSELDILDENYIIKSENIFIFNTGILHHSGSINPTASVFPIIEKHLHERS